MALPCELTSILACTFKLIIQIASNLSTERTSAVEIIIVSGKMGEGLRFWVSDLSGKDQIWLDNRKDKVSCDCLTMNEALKKVQERNG